MSQFESYNLLIKRGDVSQLRSKIEVLSLEADERQALVDYLLRLACELDKVDIVNLLTDLGAQNSSDGGDSAAIISVANGNLHCLKVLVTKSLIRIPSSEADQLIDVAAMYNQLHILSWLSEQGIDLNGNPDARQPIFWAAQEENLESLIFFAQSGVDVNVIENCENNSGMTLLITTAASGFYDGLKYLIDAGAALNHQDSTGNTALHMALLYENFECAKLLIDSSSDAYIENEEGLNSIAILNSIRFKLQSNIIVVDSMISKLA